MAKRRQTGSIRRLPSGKYQARVWHPDTGDRTTLGTYNSKADADLAVKRAELAIANGTWHGAHGADTTFADYAAAWLRDRTGLAPRTREIYAGLLRIQIGPTFDRLALKDISPALVRGWYADLTTGRSPSMAPKAYRLLRTILATAVDDDMLTKNPCRIRRAGTDRSDERPVASIPEVYALADAVPPRYRAMILLAGLGGLRTGELLALTRADLDVQQHTVSVRRQRVRLDSGEVRIAPPKTRAGRRTIALPEALVEELERHLATFVEPEADALVFTGTAGAGLDRTNFRQRVWLPATKQLGLTHLRFHDLRVRHEAPCIRAG
jgi:integrase